MSDSSGPDHTSFSMSTDLVPYRATIQSNNHIHGRQCRSRSTLHTDDIFNRYSQQFGSRSYLTFYEH